MRDDILVLDTRTGGDPGAADKMLVSSGTLGAAWVARATAVLAALGYTPANKAGDIFTGNVGVRASGAPTQGYLILGNNAAYYVGFDGSKHVIATPGMQIQNDLTVFRVGASTTGYLILGNNAANYIGFDGTNIVTNTGKIWTEGNDGPSSGLAAQTAASATTATSAGTATSATSAASASDSAALGGVGASSYARKDAASNFTTPPTINGNTIWHAGNDGPGSGLDADTLDTISSAGFIQTTGGQTITGGTGPVLQITHSTGGLALRLNGNLSVIGDTTATGTKFRRATGHDGSAGYFHAFETPLPMFMEPRRDRLVGGVARVEIPPDLANYLDLSDYFVFLTAEGPSHIYADPAERTPTSFTVRAHPGEPDISFVWCLMAVQGDMTHIERNLPVGASTDA